MPETAPWTDAAWASHAEARTDEALAAAGRPRTGPAELVKAWGRSCVQTVPTDQGTVWIKHAYALPPGEERVLGLLSRRWPGRVPRLVASWPGAVAMDPLPGHDLDPSSPADAWIAAARALAELAAGEAAHAEEWLDLGVRDRRPPAWRPAVEALLESPVVRALDPRILHELEALVPDFVARYEEAFASAPTLVHQDSGCCNIRLAPDGPLIFDWTDVVIGHPVFSCDRLLDQTPTEHQAHVVDAFRGPLGLTPDAFRAMRRSNVLHEVLRYHDELEYLAADDPLHDSLSKAVRSQLGVLVDHETKNR